MKACRDRRKVTVGCLSCGIFFLLGTVEPMLIDFPSMLYTMTFEEEMAVFAVLGVFLDSLNLIFVDIYLKLMFFIIGGIEGFSGIPMLLNVRPFCSILQIGQTLSLMLNFSILIVSV